MALAVRVSIPLYISWIRSIYYRDVSSGQQGVPCTGVGYYVNLDYAGGPWNATLDYGDFYPLFHGHRTDQRVEHRPGQGGLWFRQAAAGLLDPDPGKWRLSFPSVPASQRHRRRGRFSV